MKYVNPGMKILVNEDSASEIIDYIKNPINGYTLSGNFNIEMADMDQYVSDIYCKFDVYCDDKNDFYFDFKGLESYAGALHFDTQWDENIFYYVDSMSNTVPLSNADIISYLVESSPNTFFVHYNRGTPNADPDVSNLINWKGGTVELRINDYFFSANLDNITTWDLIEAGATNGIFNFSSSSDCPISNIIISSEIFDPKEQVIILPASTTDTDMTNNGDGSYTATKEDQYILQTIDVAMLIKKFGGKSEITSIVMAGLPAYKTTDGLEKLVSIEKNDGNIIEGTSNTLSTYYESDGYTEEHKILISKSVENMTLQDLIGKQYGFKVGV